MSPCRSRLLPFLVAALICVPIAQAQQANLRIGYAYPAGGQQGTTFEVVIAGQFLTGVDNVYVTGGGVQASIVELIRPMTGKELNELRIEVDELLARKAVVRKDFRALERFRSFKSSKTATKDDAGRDKELEEIKLKYANAAWTAADEKRLAEVRKKMSGAVRRPANPAISELALVQFTVDTDARPGVRELRIASPTALSNPLVFHVGQLIEYSEEATKAITQQRSTVAGTAFAPKSRATRPEMSITLPAVVNGQILPGAVDRFRFTARQGQQLVIVASARDLIPYIPDAVPGWFQATLALFDAAGNELAYDDDYRFNPDPVLACQIPADGEYVVEMKDAIYRGREDFVYRITIGEIPFVTSIFPMGGPAGEQTTVALTGWNLPETSLTLDNRDRSAGVYSISSLQQQWACNSVPFAVDTLPECIEVEPDEQQTPAQQVTLPLIVNGRINRPDDLDVFAFDATAGSEIVAEVHARRLQSPMDSMLTLFAPSGKQVATNDDHEDKGAGLTTHQSDSWLHATLPENGTYLLHVSDSQHQGGPEYGYRLRVSPPRPDFELRVVPSTVNVRSGSTVPLTVYAIRKDGFSGEIDLVLKDAPDGFSLHGARVPRDQDQVRLTLTVPPKSQDEPVSLSFAGRATVQQHEVSHAVVPAEDMMQAFAYRHLVPAQELKVALAGRGGARAPVRILSDLPVKIPAGASASVLISAAQSQFLRQLQLELDEPPEGISIRRVSTSREGLELVLSCDAAKVTPGLQGNLILTAVRKAGAAGKGKARGNQRRVALATLPAVPFEIIEP